MCTILLCVAFALAEPAFESPPVKSTPVPAIVVKPTTIPLPMPGSHPAFRPTLLAEAKPVRTAVSHLRWRAWSARARSLHGLK